MSPARYVESIPGLPAVLARLGAGLREARREGFCARDLRRDVLAGLVVGIVALPLALPLAMAIASASGVPPQLGLYTSIVAGAVIAIAGGSRVSVSGPTAAFVVLLVPISLEHGIGGLMTASLLAGLILLAMGVFRLGRLIQFVPHPVTTGFTTGIAVVIAGLQLKDFLGLQTGPAPEHFPERMAELVPALGTIRWPEAAVGVGTLVSRPRSTRHKSARRRFPG